MKNLNIVKKINFREMGILFALIILLGFLFLTNRSFQKIDIYLSILQHASFCGICGIGMTLCIASKHFDQSIASMMALLSCAFTALLPRLAAQMGIAGIVVAMVAIILLSSVLGSINGALVALLRIPAFIATLGTLYVYRSFAFMVSDSKPVIISEIVTPEQYEIFRFMGTGKIFGLPFAFWIMVLCAVIGTIILRKTPLGRHTLALGNSVEASRISGVNISLTKICIFSLVGVFVGVGTILNTAFLGSSEPGMSYGFEFTVISAVVLGGTSLSGGKGSVFATVIAAIFLVTITKGMNAYGVDSFAQKVVQGLILLFAFSINEIRAKIENLRVISRARREAQQI